MKNKIQYTDEPIKFKVIPNFLPGPEDLIFNEKKNRITLTLTEKTVDFFKSQAKKHGGSYQAMIRNLLDHYVLTQKA
jgi:predicted DNA binding CopG/RHH family protein